MQSDLRTSITEALRLAASPDLQLSYARRVPIADVTAEVFCTWEDHYVPDSPWLARAFAPDELAALAAYESEQTAIARRLPPHLDLAAFHASRDCHDLAAAARRALAALAKVRDDAGGRQ